jgi:hypothetical protein
MVRPNQIDPILPETTSLTPSLALDIAHEEIPSLRRASSHLPLFKRESRNRLQGALTFRLLVSGQHRGGGELVCEFVAVRCGSAPIGYFSAAVAGIQKTTAFKCVRVALGAAPFREDDTEW